MRPIELVLSKLPDAKSARGYWMARCPAHSDNRASLMVKEREDGKATVTCFAGCSCDAICGSMGIAPADLYPSKNGAAGSKPETVRVRVKDPNTGDDKWIVVRVTATYDYTDEDARFLYQVVRTEGKHFVQRTKVDGEWVYTLKGVRRVLYRLPQLMAGLSMRREIWIAEGEKDVWALESAGVVATTNSGGARDWRPEFDTLFRGARVCIVADKDDAGTERTRELAIRLAEAGATVRVVQAKEGKDAYDHLTAGLSLDDFEPRRDLTPCDPLGLLNLAAVPPRVVEFLLYPHVPKGVLTVVDGDGDVGKSFLTLAIAMGITVGSLGVRNKDQTPHYKPFDPMGVLILASEDDAPLMRSRIEQFGGDPRMVWVSNKAIGLDAQGIGYVREMLTRIKQEVKPGLLIVDPLLGFLGYTLKAGKPVNPNLSTDVRPALDGLADIAEEFDIGLMMVRHMNREGARGNGPTWLGGMGSVEIRNRSRSQLTILWHNDVRGMRVVLHDKHNYSAEGPTLAYEIRDLGQSAMPQFLWDTPGKYSREDVGQKRGGGNAASEASRGDRAMAFLTDWLGERGWVPSNDVIAEAKSQGISKNALWEAKKMHDCVDVRKVGTHWEWRYVDPFADGDDHSGVYRGGD